MIEEKLKLPSGNVLINRIAKSAMSEQLGDKNNNPLAALNTLYQTWIAGKAALLVTGNVMIDRQHLGEPANVVIDKQTDIDLLKKWGEVCNTGDCIVLPQLNHPGRQTPRSIKNKPEAPSPIQLKKMGGAFGRPVAMSDARIRQVVEQFSDAAKILEDAGFKGIQIHGAHGYLVAQFLSPLANQREDDWGGSIENRMRFLIEIIKSIKSKVQKGFIVSVKLNSSDFLRGGYTIEEALVVASALEKEGVDFIEVSGGSYENTVMFDSPSSESISRSQQKEIYFLDYAKKIKTKVSCPIMLTGGLRDLNKADELIKKGDFEIAGFARPFALFPDFAKQYFENNLSDISVNPPKVGLNQIDVMAELMWYQSQISLLSEGKKPNTNLSAWKVLASGLTRQVFEGLRKIF